MFLSFLSLLMTSITGINVSNQLDSLVFVVLIFYIRSILAITCQNCLYSFDFRHIPGTYSTCTMAPRRQHVRNVKSDHPSIFIPHCHRYLAAFCWQNSTCTFERYRRFRLDCVGIGTKEPAKATVRNNDDCCVGSRSFVGVWIFLWRR